MKHLRELPACEEDKMIQKRQRNVPKVAQPTPVEGTFVLFGNAGLEHKHLQELLLINGWKEELRSVKTAEFVWVELETTFKFDPRSFYIHCTLKNILKDEKKRVITDKGRLHYEIQSHYPDIAMKFIAKTQLLSNVERITPGEILIIRPFGTFAWAGNDILRVSTDQELETAKRIMLKRSPQAISSVYIQEPLLWEGRKMHLRMYWLVCCSFNNQETITTTTTSSSSTTNSSYCTNGFEFKTLLWEKGKILTASKQYQIGNLNDKEIHDSHAKSTPKNLFFPEDMPPEAIKNCGMILEQMRTVLDAVSQILKPNAAPFEESKIAYEVFGCDFLVSSNDFQVTLMEINERVGFQPVPNDINDSNGRYEQFTREYYNWVYENAIFPMISSWHSMNHTTSSISQVPKLLGLHSSKINPLPST